MTKYHECGSKIFLFIIKYACDASNHIQTNSSLRIKINLIFAVQSFTLTSQPVTYQEKITYDIASKSQNKVKNDKFFFLKNCLVSATISKFKNHILFIVLQAIDSTCQSENVDQ